MRSDPFPQPLLLWSPDHPTASQVPSSLRKLEEEKERKEKALFPKRPGMPQLQGVDRWMHLGALLQNSQAL